MTDKEFKELHEAETIDRKNCYEKNIKYEADFLRSLTEEEFNEGLVRIRIPSEEDMSRSDESGWAWVDSDSKYVIEDGIGANTFPAILCNQMINFWPYLCWGAKVEAELDKDGICTINGDWMRKRFKII